MKRFGMYIKVEIVAKDAALEIIAKQFEDDLKGTFCRPGESVKVVLQATIQEEDEIFNGGG